MNLHDLVRRKDAALIVAEGTAQAVEPKLPTGTRRAVALEAGTRLLLQQAHRATALKAFPSDIAWEVILDDGAAFEVVAEHAAGSESLALVDKPGRHPVRLEWPVPVPPEFDLRFESRGAGSTVLVGPLANLRERILPCLVGDGLEIGPGTNPAVLATAGRTVRYIEQKSMEDWASTYGKGVVQPDAEAHWDQYVVDSAHRLDNIGRNSIDFVFSSHVLEHLVNPLGVFSNWWERLRPGGLIAGVVPDARNTFDFRQPLSTRDDFLEQHRAGDFETTDAMYERWCRNTAPYNTPEGLRARGYSIHVNYFSVDSFRVLLDLFAELHPVSGLYLQSVPNGKDFAFLVRKP